MGRVHLRDVGQMGRFETEAMTSEQTAQPCPTCLGAESIVLAGRAQLPMVSGQPGRES